MTGPSNPPAWGTPKPRRRQGGRSDDGPISIAQAMGAVAGHLGMPKGAMVATLFSRWDAAVGDTVATHVRPERLSGTTLVVVADHPAWATQMRHLAPVVIAKLTEVCGSAIEVTELEVRVRRQST